MAGYRVAYTKKEEESMLLYIIDQKAYYFLRGVTFWKLMAQQEFTNRTYQSLKEHFRKVIAVKLQSPNWYSIPEDDRKKILSSYHSSAAPKKLKNETEIAGEFSLENYTSSDDSE